MQKRVMRHSTHGYRAKFAKSPLATRNATD
jgi:hypothetical protein